MADSTAVATQPAGGNQTMEQIRQQGAYALAERKVLTDMYKMVQAAEWGAALSEATAAAMARFCLVAGIEIPSEEIDILGGKPFRNAKHWTRRMLKDPRYIDHELINITNDKAQREEVGAPDYALAVYKVKIRKLASFAPIEKIRSGEITDISNYITVTYEANWAPSKDGKNSNGKHLDPIGFADPHKTARTRAVRRGAEKAFPATVGAQERVIEKAEQMLEAEWYEVRDDRAAAAAALPAETGPQAVSSGAGEPAAASAQNADPLPVVNATTEPATAASLGWTDEAARGDARRAFFATLRDAGIENAERKDWQAAQGLPNSFNKFTPADHTRALEALIGPTRKQLTDGVGILGYDSIEDYARARKIETPRTLRDMKELLVRVNVEIDEDA